VVIGTPPKFVVCLPSAACPINAPRGKLIMGTRIIAAFEPLLGLLHAVH
jgi:hypothetical protein